MRDEVDRVDPLCSKQGRRLLCVFVGGPGAAFHPAHRHTEILDKRPPHRLRDRLRGVAGRAAGDQDRQPCPALQPRAIADALQRQRIHRIAFVFRRPQISAGAQNDDGLWRSSDRRDIQRCLGQPQQERAEEGSRKEIQRGNAGDEQSPPEPAAEQG
jgi:hypothetical protein